MLIYNNRDKEYGGIHILREREKMGLEESASRRKSGEKAKGKRTRYFINLNIGIQKLNQKLCFLHSCFIGNERKGKEGKTKFLLDICMYK